MSEISAELASLIPIDSLNFLILSFLTHKDKMYVTRNWNNFKRRRVCKIAADLGYLDLLQWARSLNYEWNSSTTTNATIKGHLELLIWAISNGCPCNDWLTSYAAERGHLHILKCLYSKGFTMSVADIDFAEEHGQMETAAWIRHIIFPNKKNRTSY